MSVRVIHRGRVLVDVPPVPNPGQVLPPQTGFLVFGASDVTISGFQVTHAPIAAVQIRRGRFPDRSADRVVIANNELFGNGKGDIGRGVQANDVDSPTIFNNLIHDNVSTGIGILSTTNAHIINNTLYGHVDGIVLADDPAATVTKGSTQGWVINNIIAGQLRYGIDVKANATCDYIGAFNLINSPADEADDEAADYSATTPRDPSDIRGVSPRFVDPEDGDFRLLPDSLALDAGSAPAPALGLGDSSTRLDGELDMGQVDIGFHQGNFTTPVFPSVPPITREDIYVDPDGSDANDGLTPSTPLRTLAQAVQYARAVSRVVVVPGVYADHVGISTLRPAGPVEFYGDETGAVTGNAPGLVVLDANGQSDGFNITGHCSTVIDGFAIKRAKENGIFLKASHHSVVRNNRSFSNGSLGINLVDVDDVQIVNNLVYANGDWIAGKGGGIQVGASNVGPGSNRTVIQNNTIYGNSVDGILIGTANKPSPGAQIRYNIISGNGKRGLQLDNNTYAGISAPGLCIDFNINTDGYGPIASANCAACVTEPAPGACSWQPCKTTEAGCQLAPRNDLNLDPLFVGPVAGADGCLGRGGFWDDSFRLSQQQAGQDMKSPAVNLPDESAAMAGLNDRTTRTDNVVDRGSVDAGYHYVTTPPENVPPITGDCDHDGRVTVSELVRGVHIALDLLPLANCPEFDTDQDGRVDVRELSEAIATAMACRVS